MVWRWSTETRGDFYGLVSGGWSVKGAAAGLGVSRTAGADWGGKTAPLGTRLVGGRGRGGPRRVAHDGGVLVGQICAHGTSSCGWPSRRPGRVAALVDADPVPSRPGGGGPGGGGPGPSTVVQ